ncbi:tetratricopeptide repeat protein [Litoribrevibacter euphylliae]|uniref:Tetratricopeptide repeat protein n=1 Tax=Litoribrevibacter euphylliae TaxID=1834034 RepID=A0ABV7HCU0_9GAMM
MSCCETSNQPKQPLSFNKPWLVNLVFWFTSKLFHSFYPKGSEKRHQQVMRLFQFCADRQHLMANSMYGHILVFRGVTPWDKKQGVEYLKYAAQQGDVKASYQLADLMMQQAHGLNDDQSEVFSLLMVAAKGGHYLAEQQLSGILSSHPELLDSLDSEDHVWLESLLGN